MQVYLRHRALGALVCLFTAAFAVQPLVASAQTSPGTVLLMRPATRFYGNTRAIFSLAIFSISDDGFNQRQLTPYHDYVYNVPGLSNIPTYSGYWKTNAFSPNGQFSLFLQAKADGGPLNQGGEFYGKYFIMNAAGDRTKTLFPGSNDLEKPSDGPGYGSVTWGPAGTNEIAYANAPDDHAGKHPACVRLMHPDGTGNHTLWCASRYDYRGIQGLRWSGDGRSLLAYAVRSNAQGQLADLYLIHTATGAATLVEAAVRVPYALYDVEGVGDVSYDGHEVIYGVVYDTHDPGPCNEPNKNEITWCAKNMLTGQTVALVDPDNVVKFFGGQALISPDGSQAFLVRKFANSYDEYEANLYAVNTNGFGLRQITRSCVALDSDTSMGWEPVRLSPDGKRMLANCQAVHYSEGGPITKETRIFVVNLTDCSTRFVTHGTAYDWYVPM